MNRPLPNTEQRANKVPNYAQAAAKSQQQQQQQQTRGHQPQQAALNEMGQPPFVKNSGPTHNKATGGYPQPSYHGQKNSYNNSNKKDSTYVNRKASVQLPMAPPTDTAPIQFGSINQPSSSNTPLPTTVASAQQIPAQFGSSPAANDIHHRPPPSTSNQIRQSPQQQQQQLKEIPRSPRTTNDGRLFTQPYAPRRDFNQGDQHSSNNRYNNNSNNNNNNYNNNGYRNNGYARPPPPHHSPNQPYHHHPHQVQYSPQQMPHQQNLPPSPMSHRASPNMNTYNTKKNNTNISPHIPHSSPQQNIQMTATSWSPAGQYFYPQYPVSVPSYNVPPATRPPIIPPPTTRKTIAIIDPNTGVALNTSPMKLTSSSTSPSHHPPHKEEKHLDFVKPPHTSKAVSIVDPAIRDRELREKREREEAEQEALRKAEEEKKEAERKAAEEKERLEKERLEAERLEAERIKKEEEEEKRKKEQERLEQERQKEAERKEAERKEAERVRLAEEALAIAAAALEKKRQEDELRRKAEEEKESKRVISELEAEKKRQEKISAQRVSPVPSKLEIPANPLTQSPVSSPIQDSKKQQPIKVIDDFSAIHYPAGIKPPGVQDSKKHVYSIDFLLQFQQLCLDTNEDLSAINFKEMDTHSRSGSMRQPSDRGGRGGPRTPGASNLTGDNMFRMNSRDGRMEMGKFNMGRPLTARNNSSHMERQGSHGGGRGGGSMRGGRGGGGGGSGMKVIRNPAILNQQGAPTIPIEQVAPLEKTENRWVPTVGSQLAQPPAEGELMSQEYITRKVNALLNKLTMERFDSISAQIFEYARQSAKENDGRSLRTVMKLTFEKACDEPAFASMWARLCRSMYDSMTDDIKDTSILDEHNKPSSGILLFRKYLFNRCQVEFEKGWKVNMPEVDEVDGMMTEEYYAAAKAKRQGLGLIQFIGELFKLEMLSERIMYGCMIKLCNDPANAGDEEAESLCKLLTTIGKALDSKPKTAKWVDVVIQRMKNEMVLSPKLTSRVKFMIQDLVDLRKDKWVPRIGGNQVGPTTIAKIHEMAEKAKEEKEAAAASMKRNNSSRGQYIPNNNQYNNNSNANMARGNSYRGGNTNGKDYFNNNNNNNSSSNSNTGGGDGWNTVATGTNNKSRPADLSNFGKTDRSRSRTNILGPSNSPFPSLSRGKSATNMDTKNMDGRSSPATNMFSALLNGSGGDKPEERKKLNLAPRSSSTTEPSSAPEKTPKLSDEAIKRKCKNIIEEYQSIRDKKELVECVKELQDPDYLVVFIGEMLTVVEKKAQDVDDMCKIMDYLNSEKLLQKDLYVKAFKQFMEGYDDLTIDVPQAPKYVAQLLVASSVSPEEVGGDEYDSLQKAYKTLVESN